MPAMPNGGALNRLRLFKDYLLRKPVCSAKPVEISIETTTKCNLRCPMCTREQLVPSLTNMDLALFKRIIDQGQKYLELVVPMNLGEPLMNPQIYEIIRYCKNKDMNVLISTNGTLLNENNSRKLLESGVDYLIFSFDGASKEIYERYRAGADFGQVRANLLSFFKMKRELKSRTHCVIQMVVLKDNQGEIEAFRDMWDAEDVEIRFKPNLVLGEEFSIPRTLDQNPATLKKPCFHLWRGSFVVRVDGIVFPCCWSYNTLPVGDLKTQSLDEVWNSPEMLALRKKHAAGTADQIPTCRNCSLIQPEVTSLAAAFLLTGPQVRRLLPVREKIVAFFEKLRPQK